MDEYAALAQRFVLSMTDVRGCLVLSRDGLVLGAYPEEDETAVKPAWLKFVTLGEVRKSFVELSDQIWAYVYRGPYAMFVVAGMSVRPGVLLDQLEQALLTAEEGRTKRDPMKVPDAAAAPTGKPRTPLHPQVDREPAPVAEALASEPVHDRRLWSTTPMASSAATGGSGPEAGTGWPRPAASGETHEGAPPAPPTDGTAPGPAAEDPVVAEAAPSALKREPQRLVSSERGADDDGSDEPGDIDRVLLAKEFSGLLQVDRDPDEGSS
jgi:hypothetical protein